MIDSYFEVVRSWMNGGIITADITDARILRDHIVRPKFWGTPNNGMVGRVHKARRGQLANALSSATIGTDIARVRDRDSFKPFRLTPGDTQLWRTRFGASEQLPEISYVEVSCQGAVEINLGTGWTAANEFGRLALAYIDRSDPGTVVVITDSAHELGPEREHFSCRTLATLSAGDYDFLLVYDRRNLAAGASGDLQFDVRTVNFTVDIMPTVTP